MKLIIFVRCIIHIRVIWLGMYTRMYSYKYIPGGQKSQSGNQVAVNTDFYYSRTLDQSYL